MKLEVGKTYVNRLGNQETVIKYDETQVYAYVSDKGLTYRENGKYDDGLCELDLIEEVSIVGSKDLDGLKNLAAELGYGLVKLDEVVLENFDFIIKDKYDDDECYAIYLEDSEYEKVKDFNGLKGILTFKVDKKGE